MRLAIVFSFDASKFVKRSDMILVLKPRQSNSAPSTPKITTVKISNFFILKIGPGIIEFEIFLKC